MRVFDLVMSMKMRNMDFSNLNIYTFELETGKIKNPVIDEYVNQIPALKSDENNSHFLTKEEEQLETQVSEYEKYYDSNYKTYYYYNRRKNISSWSVPDDEKVKILDMTEKQKFIE